MDDMTARRPRFAWPVLVGLLLAACTGPTAATSSQTVATTRPSPTTAAPTDEPSPCLTGAQPFSQEGGAGTSIRTGSDAQTVGAIRWTRYTDCEQMTVELLTSDFAPAVDPPSTSGFFFREAGVLRVSLGQEIVSSLVTDRVIETPLVHRAFVVTAPDGGIFVDLHLAAPAFARVSAGSSPARAVIELQPGGPEYESPAVIAGSTVLVDPATTQVRYPFSAAGYTVAETTVNGVLRGQDEEVTVAAAVAPRPGTWGGFVLLFPDGPLGEVTFEVGDEISLTLNAE